MRAMTVLGVFFVVTVLGGCPEGERQREQLIDDVGHAPAAQIDHAKERLERAEQNIQKKADEAAAATAEE